MPRIILTPACPEPLLQILVKTGFFRAVELIHLPGRLYREFVDRLSRECGGGSLDEHLPSVQEYGETFGFPVGDEEIEAGNIFGLLCKLTKAVLEKIGPTGIFWAVLGPIQDAMSWDAARGCEMEIEAGRLEVLRSRGRQNLADLWDYWLWFQAEDADRTRREAFDRLMACMDRAGTSEAEAFFNSLDLMEAGPEPWRNLPECWLPDPEGLWRRVLSKSGLSRKLLTRAGLYYWHTSERHHGWPLALAALGVESEDPEEGSIPPSLALWAGARDAASQGMWEVSHACFVRAILDVGIQAKFTNGRWRRNEVNAFRFETDFVRELGSRFGNGRAIRASLYFAAQVLLDSDVDQDSMIWRALERVGRALNMRSVRTEVRLMDVVGRDVWYELQEETRQIVIGAECFWRYCEDEGLGDRSIVAVEYRRGVEHEWRSKIGPTLADWITEETERVSLGQMLRAVRDANAFQQAYLQSEFGRDTRLFSAGFVHKAIRLVDKLNQGAHGEGLDRERCAVLRDELLRGGMLRGLLESVQRRN